MGNPVGNIQFQRNDSDEIRLQKLRRLSDAVDAIASRVQQTVNNGGGGGSSTFPDMTGPAVLGRLSGTGQPGSLSGTQVMTMLPVFSASTKGVVNSPGTSTGNRYLRDDGAWSPVTATVPFAIPTVPVGLNFDAGVATTAIRSDARLAIDQGITPSWTDQHEFALRPTVGGQPVLIDTDLFGGTKHQVLTKLSDTDGDYDWGSSVSTSGHAYLFEVDLSATSGDPGPGVYRYSDTSDQLSSTSLFYDYLSDDGVDIFEMMMLWTPGDLLYLQVVDDGLSYQIFRITNVPIDNVGYFEIPVEYVSSFGDGSTGFAQDQRIMTRWLPRYVRQISAGTGITVSPSPITDSGTVAVDLAAPFSWTNQHQFFNTFPIFTRMADSNSVAGVEAKDESGNPTIEMVSVGTAWSGSYHGIDPGTSGINAATQLMFAVDDTPRFAINTHGAWGIGGTDFGTAGTVFKSTGSTTAPVWAAIDLAADVTGDLPLTNIEQIATSSFLGRTSVGTGDIEVLTGTQATTLLDVFTSTLQGVVPASGGGTTNFLRADGTWVAAGGGGGGYPQQLAYAGIF